MNCAEAKEGLSEAIDGAAEAGLRGEIDGHLAGCADCRDHRAQLEGVRSLLRSLEVTEPEAGFVGRMGARVMAGLKRPKPMKRGRRVLAAVAPGAVLIGIAALFTKFREEKPEVKEREVASVATPAPVKEELPKPPPLVVVNPPKEKPVEKPVEPPVEVTEPKTYEVMKESGGLEVVADAAITAKVEALFKEYPGTWTRLDRADMLAIEFSSKVTDATRAFHGKLEAFRKENETKFSSWKCNLRSLLTTETR